MKIHNAILPILGFTLFVSGLVAPSIPKSYTAEEITTTDPIDRRTPRLFPEIETITRKQFTLSVPKGWRSHRFPNSPNLELYITGDGKGIPIIDEHGSPLQIGMMVERFTKKETLDEGVEDLVEAAKQSPLLALATGPIVENTQLSDKTPAKLVVTQFRKPPARRSLQLKLCLKDGDAHSWVISGWIVAGEKSALPTLQSDLAKRLRELLESFAFRAPPAK